MNKESTIKVTEMFINNEIKNYVHPVLHIVNSNGNQGYLVPFRLYSFQVCGTPDGHWDYGSSDPQRNLMYDIVVNNDIDTAKLLLKKEVCKCINGYLNTSYGYTHDRRIAYTVKGEPQYTYNIINWEIPRYGEYNEFYDIDSLDYIDEFIDATYKLVCTYYDIKVA